MTAARLSVIVASRHRPEALVRCVKALRQQIGVLIEVIVVADPESCQKLQADDLKIVVYDEANISVARNRGLAEAAAPFVAFIDDDAVAEPTWAARLYQGLNQKGLVAATGFVLGRNGLSYQWRAAYVDGKGVDHPFEAGDQDVVPRPSLGLAVKLQGTNCALSTVALRQAGGFDPAYRFYLDDADLSLRISRLGQSAIVPGAQVHHGFLASERRRADRVPLSLHDIGASMAVFLRRHCPESLAEGYERLAGEQKARLNRHLSADRLTRATYRALMASLDAGWDQGLGRELSVLEPLCHNPASFLPVASTANGGGAVLGGWWFQRDQLIREAARRTSEGVIVSVLCLTPGWRRHRHRYCNEGYWLQTGGVWGKADRSLPPPLFSGPKRRMSEFIDRISKCRPTQRL